MTKIIIMMTLLTSTLAVGAAAQTPTAMPTEPTVTWQELQAYVGAPAAASPTADQVQLLVETWDNMIALNNADGVIAVSTRRFQEASFGTTDGLRAAFSSPVPEFVPDRSGDITVRDARQVDEATLSAFVHLSGYEDSDRDPGRVYFGIFKRDGSVWKIDYFRPDLYVVEESAPSIIITRMTAAEFERDGLPERPASWPDASSD